MHTLERNQIIPAARDELFTFFGEPRNLEKMTPVRMGFRILKMDDSPMRPGFRIKYRIKVFGAPIRWLTTITEYEPGRRFVDEQTTGPYAFWRHEHLFERRPFGRVESAGAGEIVGSNFERKYRREGRAFFGMALKRC